MATSEESHPTIKIKNRVSTQSGSQATGNNDAGSIGSRGGASWAQPPTHTAERMLAAAGAYPTVGGFDDVVDELRRMSEAGLDGIAIGLVNYIGDMPAPRDEILPRIERLGLRGRGSGNRRISPRRGRARERAGAMLRD